LPILRLKKGESFGYLINNKPLTKKSELQRIENLVIPPAWNDVKITNLENAHLQAVGYDIKQRRQYRYHPIWLKLRNRTKFYRMLSFGQVLPAIRTRVERDLEIPNWSKNKVLALIVRLMEETHIRVGNKQYAKRNKTYGISSLRTKHVAITKDKVRFKFTGKKGKKHNITIRNKRLVQLVSKCEEIPGWELFQFFDEDGKKTAVDSGMINDYIQNISGDTFTAKDFRTWAGTVIFFDSLMSFSKSIDPKKLHSNILEAYDEVAKELGNTRNVCRKYYVHPLLPSAYEKGELDIVFDTIDEFKSKPNQSVTEAAVLSLIKNYHPLQGLKK
jgi:DNA topoisomerase-1